MCLVDILQFIKHLILICDNTNVDNYKLKIIKTEKQHKKKTNKQRQNKDKYQLSNEYWTAYILMSEHLKYYTQ